MSTVSSIKSAEYMSIHAGSKRSFSPPLIQKRGDGSRQLEAIALTLGFSRVPVIENFSQRFPAGRVTAIIGPNGCGKSTLLAGLARLKRPIAGTVQLEGESLYNKSPRWVAHRMALLPQYPQAPEGISVAELIRFGRQPYQRWWQQWSKEDQQQLEYALHVTQVSPYAHKVLGSLSGGQRQRAWLAMTIAQATPCLLLDEPTSALDIGHQIEVFELIRQLSRNEGKTVIMVVHDLMNACRYADHLIAMYQGKILVSGKPEDVMTPQLMKVLYQVSCEIILDPLTHSPMLTQVRACQEAR